MHFVGVWKLRKQLQYVHPIVKLFSFILVVQVLSVMCYLIHYFKFGENGEGFVWLQYSGAILDAIARIVFIFLLLLLAHGWTISNDHLHQRWIIAGVLGVFFVLQVAQLGYNWFSYNPELTAINKGDFVFQILIVAIYLLIGVYFVFMLVVSYVNEIIPPKKKLYLRLAILFTPWMLGPPMVAVGVLLLDDWVRAEDSANSADDTDVCGLCRAELPAVAEQSDGVLLDQQQAHSGRLPRSIRQAVSRVWEWRR